MKNVKIFEQELKKGSKIVGKISILQIDPSQENATSILDVAVEKYIAYEAGNTFILSDNPFLKVVIKGINEIEFHNFQDQQL